MLKLSILSFAMLLVRCIKVSIFSFEITLSDGKKNTLATFYGYC